MNIIHKLRYSEDYLCDYFNPSKLSACTSLRQNTSVSMGQEELRFILPTSAFDAQDVLVQVLRQTVFGGTSI